MTETPPALYLSGMNAMRYIGWVILLLSGWQAFAHEPADGKIYVTAGSFLSRTLPLHHQWRSDYHGGAALIAEGDIGNSGGIEISILSLDQEFSIQRDTQTVIERDKRIYIGFGYRHWFTPRFSSALAFFSNYSAGEPVILQSDFQSTQPPATSAEEMTKYGFDFSVQYEPIVRDRLSLVFDGRYSWSVTSKPGEDENFYALMIGLKYYLQGPDAPKSASE